MDRPLGYTTVQTRLNRLVAKGVVARSNDRPARYRAAVRPDEVSAGISICSWIGFPTGASCRW